VRRLAALAALVLTAAAVVMALVIAVQNFPRGLTVLACLVAAMAISWWSFVRAGAAQVVGLTVAALLWAGAVALVIFEGKPLQDLVVLVTYLLALGAARLAFAPQVELPPAEPPQRAVLFYNPKSGGGKATRFHLAEEARARGIEPIELTPGQDLWELVRGAIERGADALAMAGGDGSQAIVAAMAAEHGLPYACIPSGTRNHFALDLGVDRDDVVGALDALVDGGERVVDLATVNGRVFVNNVSLGLYAEAVQRSGYREAKLRTIARTAPEVLGPQSDGLHLSWTQPDGREGRTAAALLISNDPYRLGHALASGTRPSLDSGLLGVAVLGERDGPPNGRPIRQWSTPSFEVASDRQIPAGIDGEAAMLDPPLRFETRPGVLRVRIARQHPGASPSAMVPAKPWDVMRALARLAFGRGAPDSS
jgi:diacylglycerol kinase family enzyme